MLHLLLSPSHFQTNRIVCIGLRGRGRDSLVMPGLPSLRRLLQRLSSPTLLISIQRSQRHFASSRPPNSSNSGAKPPHSNLNALLLKMPRQNKTHIADAQRQRLRIKEKASRYTPGTVSLQVLGSGAPGSPASVYLFTDQSRYLFNAGEGTQRLAHEHKTKLARLENIFLTRTSWQRIGGLPGLSLTVQDAGVPALALHGPPGLGELFGAMRRFVILKELRVEAVRCGDGERYDDAVLSVEYVPLVKGTRHGGETSAASSRPPTPASDDTDYFAHETQPNGAKSTLTSTAEEAAAAAPTTTRTGEENQVMAFVCRLKPRPGALSLEKCVDRGVPTGPLLGQLKAGIDIRLPDGTVVHARDVRSPDDPGPTFCVLDVPAPEYLDALGAATHRFCGTDGEEPTLFVHFSPVAVMQSAEYRAFMARFGRATTHLVLNESNRFSGYLAAHRIQCQLNQISEHMFPMLQETELEAAADESADSPPKRIRLDDEEETNTPPAAAADVEVDDSNVRCEGAGSLTHYHLRPLRGLDRLPEPRLNPAEYRAETQHFEGFAASLAALHADIAAHHADDVRRRRDQYPRIVFLGTGSCIPNKTRNVSAILVHTTADACVLLDCGEGTAAQMRRFYGAQRYAEVLVKLRAIYVSHLHADHHIGLIGVLQERRAALRAAGVEAAGPLLLLAPQQIASWLWFYDRQIEGLRHEYELVHNGDLLTAPLSDARTQAMGIHSIRTCPVRHCPHSFGVAIECANTAQPRSLLSNDRFKLCYSGDTMPCEELVALGADATVLIHEATMEDELAEQARYKMHSTVSQAVEQGRRMQARYTILTHFSQRYAKLPRIEADAAAASAANVFVAFDNMEVTLADLRYLGRALPTMQLMFTDHCEEMEQKALKRAFKAERAAEAAQAANKSE